MGSGADSGGQWGRGKPKSVVLVQPRLKLQQKTVPETARIEAYPGRSPTQTPDRSRTRVCVLIIFARCRGVRITPSDGSRRRMQGQMRTGRNR
eukprot:17082-Eustigmatos_ZCMA.PRE.1